MIMTIKLPIRSVIIRPALTVVAVMATMMFVGCEDKVSTLGSPFFSDTVQFNTTVRSDLGFMRMRSVASPTIIVGGLIHNITIYSPIMLIGNVTTQYENIQSWGVLQFPVLPDTTLAKVIGVRLL